MLSFVRRINSPRKLINNLEQCFLSSTNTAIINPTRGYTLCHSLNVLKNYNNELFIKKKLICFNNQVNYSHSLSQ